MFHLVFQWTKGTTEWFDTQSKGLRIVPTLFFLSNLFGFESHFLSKFDFEFNPDPRNQNYTKLNPKML